MQSARRLGIVDTSLEQKSGVNDLQIDFIFFLSSCFDLAGDFFSSFFISRHNVSIGDMSGLLAGHGRSGTLLIANHVLHVYDTWQGALSCWKIYSPSADDNLGIEDRMWNRRMFKYFSVLTVPSKNTKSPTPRLDIHPQIIIDDGNLVLRDKQSEWNASPLFLQTYLPDVPKQTSNLDSSLHIIESHCLCTQVLCSFAHSRRFRFCLGVINGFSLAF